MRRGRGRPDRRGDGVRRRPAPLGPCRPRRRRGAAARAGRHPRPRQRAGPHRVGGLRDRDPRGRRRRRDDDRRHAAQLDPADDHASRRWRSSVPSPQGQCFVDVGFWGGAVPGNLADLAPLHEAGVFGFKCFLLDSGVDGVPAPAGRARSPPRWRRPPRLGALMIVHAEDGVADRRRPPWTARATPASWPRGPRPPRRPRSRWSSSRHGRPAVVRTSCTCPTRDAVPHAAVAHGATGVDVSVETCPHYLTFEAEQVPDGATELKCCPPIREADNREALWAALGAGDIDLVVVRPLAVHGGAEGRARTSGWPGAASPRCSSACRPCGPGPGRAGTRSSTWCGGWRRRPADRVGLLGPGADRRRRAGRPGAVRARRVVHRGRRRGSSTATPCRRTPATASLGEVRETWLRGVPVDDDVPRGQLLARGT